MEKKTEWQDVFPAILVIFITMVSPYLFPYEWRHIAPPLGFAAIFFWLRRTDLPLWSVVICGVLLDVLQAMPVGTGVSAALLLFWLARSREERTERQSFTRNAVRHGWVSALVMGWVYLLMSLVHGQFFPLQAPVFQWLALVASYPLIYAFCHAMHQYMGKPAIRSL